MNTNTLKEEFLKLNKKQFWNRWFFNIDTSIFYNSNRYEEYDLIYVNDLTSIVKTELLIKKKKENPDSIHDIYYWFMITCKFCSTEKETEKDRSDLKDLFNTFISFDETRTKHKLVNGIYEMFGYKWVIECLFDNAKIITKDEFLEIFPFDGEIKFDFDTIVNFLNKVEKIDDVVLYNLSTYIDVFSLDFVEFLINKKIDLNSPFLHDYFSLLILEEDLPVILKIINNGFFIDLTKIESPIVKGFIIERYKIATRILQFKITDCVFKPGGVGYLKAKEHFDFLAGK